MEFEQECRDWLLLKCGIRQWVSLSHSLRYYRLTEACVRGLYKELDGKVCEGHWEGLC